VLLRPGVRRRGPGAGFVAAIVNVTEGQRTREALRESEERLRTLSDNLPHGAVYQGLGDPEGRRSVTYISAGIERLFGVTPAEVMADANALYGLIHEEDQRRVQAEEEIALRGLAPFDCEFRSWTRWGSIVWVHCRSAPRRLPTGQVVWEGVILDVTDRKRAEADLARLTAESERLRRLYETALSNTADFNYTFDLEGRVTYANEPLLALWGKPLHEAVGKNFFDLGYPPELAERLQRQIRKVIDTRRPLRDETPYASPAGTREYEYIFVPVVGASGAVEAVAGSTRDISDRKALEVTLQEQAEQLLQADRRKDEFLAMLAHELRNPLAPIRNAAQVIRLLGTTEPNVQRSTEVIERQVQTMARLVDDLLDVSRITTGKIKLQKEPVELATVVARAVEAARPLIEARRHALTVRLPPEAMRLEADVTRLAQVVGNLLANAAKYTENGGRIELGVARHGNIAVVRVRDNGVGIPAAMLPRIFDLFVQVDRSLARSEGGLGIGLTLVKSLVEMHGGSVEAHSEGLGRGSEFVVRLPVLQTRHDPNPDQAERSGDYPSPPRRILVVDDNVDAAASLAMLLQVEQHDVRTAHDGPTALHVAEAFRPEVIFLDIGLPRMDGYEVARRLRKQAGLEKTLLVALTGYGQEEDRRRSQQAGFDAHLVKPADPVALQQLLAGLGGGG
jgi:PAS domain S-box-containing protein